MQSNLWRLEAGRAQLQLAPLTAQLDLNDLRQGFTPGEPGAAHFARLLGLESPNWQANLPALRDCFTRGNDLIAYYDPQPSWPIGLELHWSAAASASSQRQLDLQISAQTPLLDCNPRIDVLCELTAGEVLRIAAGAADSIDLADISAAASAATLCRPAESSYSLLLMVHPTDYCTGQLTRRDGAIALRQALFTEHLEKGVIRRARLRCLLLDRADDLAVAARELERFSAEDPDLSA